MNIKKISMSKFFKILETTPRGWELRGNKIELIIIDSTEGRANYLQDPLTAVATELADCYYNNNSSDWDWYKAGKDMGFSHEEIMAIFNATNSLEGYNPELKEKLLKSTGLL
jgi:hypothetical protein